MNVNRAAYIYLYLFIIIFIAGCGGGTNGNKDDNGNSASTGRSISNSGEDSFSPVMAADSNGNVYVAWEEKFLDKHIEISLASSNNSGLSFSPAKSISDESDKNCGRSGEPPVPSDVTLLARDGSSPLLAWIDSWITSKVSEVKFFRDNGPFCTEVSDSFDIPTNVYSHYMALRGSEIHMAWAALVGDQKEIYYRRSKDDGNTFIPSDKAMKITDTSLDSSEPLLGFEGSSNVDMAWVEGDEPERDVMFTWSWDGGDYFLGPVSVSDGSTDSYCPVMKTTADGNIFIAYKGVNGNSTSIYFSKWIKSSSSFSFPVNISPGSKSPTCPEMVLGQNGVIYIVWPDNGGIYVSSSGDNGNSFSQPKDISPKDGYSSYPDITIDGSYANIVWVEEETGSSDIYFSGSRDNGKTFSSPRNISNSSSTSTNPAIASDGKNYIYIAWEEGEDGKREIFFKREEGARGHPQPSKKPLTQFLDISGDGKSDILIGAPMANDSGAEYLFYSDYIKFTGVDTSTAHASYTLSEGITDDQFGDSAAIAGDINGDGYADVIVSAPFSDDGGNNYGKVYIYYGGPPSIMDIDADFTISGAPAIDYSGISVSPAGDVNGDGFDDIIIGLPKSYASKVPYSGSAYIFFGGPTLGNKSNYPNLSIDDADLKLSGENGGDRFGDSVSWAGDFNNDGYDDVIVGAPLADKGSTFNNRGRAYIFYGGASMDSTPDVKITGAANSDQLGNSVAMGGDINGDGYEDVIIGAYNASGTLMRMGKAYVVYGGDYTNMDIDLAGTSTSVTVLNGIKNNEFFGYSIGYAGDVNNDGFDDVLVGSKYQGQECIESNPDTTCKRYFQGNAYIFFGGPSMDTTADVTFTGEDFYDKFGAAVAGAGDVNGDGYCDILVGAYLKDNNESNNVGKAYLYLGNNRDKINNVADATFTGVDEEGRAGYSVYRIGE